MKYSIAISGIQFEVKIVPSHDAQKPWEDAGNGSVREASASWTGHPALKAGEKVLHQNRHHYWIFDYAGATKQAKAESWGIGDDGWAALTKKLGREPTSKEVTKAAVDKNFDYLKSWLSNDWGYVDVGITPIQLIAGVMVHVGETRWLCCVQDLDSGDVIAAQEIANDYAIDILAERSEQGYWNSRDVLIVKESA